MRRIYLSYSKHDSEAALYLSTQLRGRGLDVYVNYDRLMNGGSFTRRAAKELQSRDDLILIISTPALASPTVEAEVMFAFDHNINVVPILIEQISLTGDLQFLADLRPIDFTFWHLKQPQEMMHQLERRLLDLHDDTISVETIGMLTEIATLRGHTSWVRSVAFSPDGTVLASASNDNTIRLWDNRAKDPSQNPPRLMTTIDAHDASAWDVRFSPRDALLASCANDNSIRLWAMETLPETYEFSRFTDHHDSVHALAFSNDGKLLASASSDNSVHVRDIRYLRQTGRAETTVPLLHAAQVYSVAFSPNTRWLASASRDSGVRLWEVDANNLRELPRSKPYFLRGHKSWVNAVAFSPDGRWLASASHDATIILWDIETRQPRHILSGHRDSVNTVTFSPDGALLASTSKDNAVCLWDVTGGRQISIVHGHTGWVNSVAFSPDGMWMVTASGDNTIKYWGVGKSALNR
ncbi:MAG: TIR domain-containing protein [Aggregatilineales bacterium]